MEQKQQIKDQLGALEEQIELLGAHASANEQFALTSSSPMIFGSDLHFADALQSLSSLGTLVNEQQLLKSIPAADFLNRIIGMLVQEAAAQGIDIAVTHYGEGKVSMEMAELVMGAIISGMRASLRSCKNMDRAERLRHHLFSAAAIYIEVRATAEEIQFRIVDDGKGYRTEAVEDQTPEKHFQKLRLHIARSGGWFRRTSFDKYGGVIEFKVPLQRSRFEALLIRQGSTDFLLPSSCVAELVESGREVRMPAGTPIYRIDPDRGLVVSKDSCSVLVRIGVADVHIWLGCDAVLARPRTRCLPAGDFVADDSWYKNFGLYQDSGTHRILPLLEGQSIIRMHGALGGNA